MKFASGVTRDSDHQTQPDASVCSVGLIEVESLNSGSLKVSRLHTSKPQD